ncbi:unnamed protein product [Auanema sp. JU1783]|nr:unnamed protein product [Auanema sp. JU1783]
MGDIVLPLLVPADEYSETEGKLAASLRWLINRVYEKECDIPDKLRNGISRDDKLRLQVDQSVLFGLINGSLYNMAAAKIFKEPHLVQASPAAVLAALTDYGIDVIHRPEEGGQPVVDSDLTCREFRTSAHLAVMDALMLAHLRDVITVERVVESVSRHTSVDDRERPMDSADALLFWINKICLLIRDEVERSQIMLKGSDDGGMIPEMEDLYDDISDGQCLCAMIAFYRPREMDIQEVCFNEQMSNPDCQYNLTLLREFCRNNLPLNIFHFEVEDILYLHDSLQMNINVFLADLFEVFEPAPIIPPQMEVQSPRRFVPIQPFSDLRAANVAARSAHPPRVRNPFSVHVSQTTPTRSMSMMSQDSLMTNRSNDTWRANQFQRSPEHWGANVTNFGRLNQAEHGSNGNLSQVGQYTRSDSLPGASIRLQLEEKRRDHEMRKLMQNSLTESERAEKGKAAFFAVMNQAKSATQNQNDMKLLETVVKKMEALEEQFTNMQIGRDSRLGRTVSQPSVYQDLQPASARPDFAVPRGGYQQQPQQQYDPYYGGYVAQDGHYAQPQQQQPQTQMRSSLSNGMINYLPAGQSPYDYQQSPQQQQLYSQGQYSVYNSPHQMGPQPGFQLNPMHQSAHASTGFSMHQQQQPQQAQQMMMPPFGQNSPYQGVTPLDLQHQQQNAYHQQQHPSNFSYAGTPENMPPNGFESHSNAGTFRLHSNDTSNSRLDPPLELNRNLTNWGMTMKAGHTPGRNQRRMWENQTFIKNEMDLVNHPDLVPVVTDSEDFNAQRRSPSVVGTMRKSRDSKDESITDEDKQQAVNDPDQTSQYSSPPRDPGVNSQHILNNSASNVDSALKSSAAPAAPVFVVTDEQAASDFDKIAEQRREAKKAALLAKTMKRKEESGVKMDQIEQRNMERKLAEEAKREMAEQRKVEKEMQRQKILEDYKRKKMEKDLGEVSSARLNSARGQSQPPFERTKSQMTTSTSSATPPRLRGASTVEQRISVQSLQEPTHKLYSKVVPKSNRGLMVNALQYSVFPGAVNDSIRTKTMNDLATSIAKHFLILFRDHKCQYRGLYAWDQQSDTVEKISGQGPSKCREDMMNLMFKYDSGGKSFSQIPTKHLGATIDGFSIQDAFWQKAKIPHSKAAGKATHKDN